MEESKRASVMERVLRDNYGEGNSVAFMARRYGLSEASIRAVLRIKEEPMPVPPSRPAIVRFWKRLGL